MSAVLRYYEACTKQLAYHRHWYKVVKRQMGLHGMLSCTTTLLLTMMPETVKYIARQLLVDPPADTDVGTILDAWRHCRFTPQMLPFWDWDPNKRLSHRWITGCIKFGHLERLDGALKGEDLVRIIKCSCRLGDLEVTLKYLARIDHSRLTPSKWAKCLSNAVTSRNGALVEIFTCGPYRRPVGSYNAAVIATHGSPALVEESGILQDGKMSPDGVYNVVKGDNIEVFIKYVDLPERHDNVVERYFLMAHYFTSTKILRLLLERYPDFDLAKLYDSGEDGDILASLLEVFQSGNADFIELVFDNLCRHIG